MKTYIIDESDVTPELDESIRMTLTLCFPHRKDTFSKERRWRGNEPLFNAIVEDGEIVCGYVAVVDRTIRIGNSNVRVAGVGMVAVAPLWRERRLIDNALAAAMDESKKRGFDFGFLFTHRPTNKIYERNGWLDLAERKVIRIEDGQEFQLPAENVRMYFPLLQNDFPQGPIHLLGDKW
jgi:nodulation protein A